MVGNFFFKSSVIERFLFRETLFVAGATTVVLLSIFLVDRSARLFSAVTSGEIASDTVLQLLMLQVPRYLVILLPLAFFLAVIIVLGRLSRDHERVALQMCGFSPWQIAFCFIRLATLGVFIVALFSFWIAPLASEKAQSIESRMEGESATLHDLVSGRFKKLDSLGGVLYVEEVSKDKKKLKNIFIQSQEGEKVSILSAQRGYITKSLKRGGRYFVLEEGFRYEGVPGEAEWTVTQYEQHGIRLQEQARLLPFLEVESTPSSLLFRADSLAHQVELQWRVTLPLMVFVLILLAVAFTFFQSYRGRLMPLFYGVLIYVVYSNLLGIIRSSLEGGGGVGFEVVHAVAFLLGVTLLSWKQKKR